MKKNAVLTIGVILVLVLVVAIWIRLKESSPPTGEFSRLPTKSMGREHLETSATINSETLDNQDQLPKARYREVEERTGLTIPYDEIVDSDKLLSMFSDIDVRTAERLRRADIKTYLRGDQIVMMKLNAGCFESVSYADRAFEQLREEGHLEVVRRTSDYMKISDPERMEQLLRFLSSEGWDFQHPITKYERILVFLEVEPLKAYMELSRPGDPVRLGETYPGYLYVRSSGAPPKGMSLEKPWPYPKDMLVQRVFRFKAIAPREAGGLVDFESSYLGSGFYLYEPTPQAIAQYGLKD